MDKFPKYVIEGKDLILAKVSYHKELVNHKELVKGGGWFRYNHDSRTFVLGGESHEFGRASLEDVLACVEADRVYTNVFRTHSIANDFKFQYDRQSELVDLN